MRVGVSVRLAIQSIGLVLLAVPVPLAGQGRFGTPGVQIGAADEPESSVFGAIADVQLLADGRIIVLDSRLHRLRLYAQDGRFIDEIGRPGGGPGEFLLPVALSAVGDTLLVLDSRAARIAEFVVSDRLRYRDSKPAPSRINDICSVGGRLFALGFLDGHVLHELRLDGHEWRIVNSFGSPGAEGLIGMGFSDGYLACSADLGFVAWTSRQAGTVAAFGLDGTPLWAQPIPDFERMRITQGMNGRVTYQYPNDDQWHHMVAGMALFGSQLLVTTGRATPTTGADDDPIDLQVLTVDARTGRVGPIQPVPGVLRTVDSPRGRWWFTSTRPFPRILGLLPRG